MQLLNSPLGGLHAADTYDDIQSNNQKHYTDRQQSFHVYSHLSQN